MKGDSATSKCFEAIRVAMEALEPLDSRQREFAFSMIRTGLGMPVPNGSNETTNVLEKKTDGVSGSIKLVTPKDFLREKKPHTDLERLICLAYYLTHNRDIPHFKTEDITALNTEAAGAKFSNASATARNAVSQSGFLSHAGAGKKQLTPLGEDVVNALPDREAMEKVIAEAPKRRKSRPKTKLSTK